MGVFVGCSMEMEAQREKREREAWEREIRDMRELEFLDQMKHEMELKLPGTCPVWIVYAFQNYFIVGWMLNCIPALSFDTFDMMAAVIRWSTCRLWSH